MKVKIDAKLCIGCELCTGTTPEVFEMDGSVAVVIGNPIDGSLEDDVQSAIEECPVEAISAS